MAYSLALFGGHGIYDSVFSKFTALPYGVGDNGGCVLSILMSYAPLTGTNCGAGGYDAVTEYQLATNNPPWYMVGEEIEDENGISHTLEFGPNYVIVRPQISDSGKSMIKPGAHLITNIVAGPTVYGGINLADTDETHKNRDSQFYGNMFTTFEDGSDSNGTYTKLNMTGNWTPTSGNAVDSGHVPLVGSNNTSSDPTRVDSLDTDVYSEFKKPILAIGVYIKHFTRNTSCEVIVKDGTDGTAVKRYGPSRKCDEELDNWYHGPDYGATMHGLTIGAGFDNKVSNDSYGLAIAGAWPTGIRAWLGSDGYDFDGDEFVSGSRKGAPPVIGNKKPMMQWFQNHRQTSDT